MQLLHEPLPRHQRVVLGVIGTVAVTAVAELVVRGFGLDRIGLPVPSRVLVQAVALLGDGAFLVEVVKTLQEWMVGLLLAALVGTVVGGLMGASRLISTMLELPVEILRPLPSIAIGPLLVLLLGAGWFPLAVTVAVACVWPILFNAVAGVQATDPVALQTARTFGISPIGQTLQIRLPSAAPFVFTGIQVASSIGLIVAVSAELLIGNGTGIGGFILVRSASTSSLDTVYAATLIAGVMGVGVSALFAGLNNVLFGWRKGLAQ